MRIASGIFAALFSVALAAPASAGCCGCNNGWGWGGGWNTGWGWDTGWGGGWNAGWGSGCGATVVVPARPVFVQPAPILVQPAPVLVQPAPVLVQPAPIVVRQAPIVAYAVNQGPVFSGPGSNFSPSFYQPARPLGAYPYVGGGARFATGYYSDHGRYQSSYRPHRTYRGADRMERAPRRSDYRAAPLYHRNAVPPVKYYK